MIENGEPFGVHCGHDFYVFILIKRKSNFKLETSTKKLLKRISLAQMLVGLWLIIFHFFDTTYIKLLA